MGGSAADTSIATAVAADVEPALAATTSPKSRPLKETTLSKTVEIDLLVARARST